MPKSAVLLTDLQLIYLIELFENDSINNKRIEIPLRINLKFNTNYSYSCLNVHYLKICCNKNSTVNINSSQKRYKNNSEERISILNGKSKLKNDVVVNKDQIFIKQNFFEIVQKN
jgi:hypothetical protein